MRWLILFYPPAWRGRYQEEMLALLEQHNITWRTWFDLLRGALDARLDPHFRTQCGYQDAGVQLRRAHSAFFWAFPALILGYMFFLDGLDDAFYTWNQTHAAIRQFKTGSEFLLALGVAVFLLMGIWLAILFVRELLGSKVRKVRGGGRMRSLRYAVLLAPGVCGLYSVRAILSPLLPLIIVAIPFPLAVGILHCEVSHRVLRFALFPLCLTFAAMATQLLYTAVWGGAIWNTSAPVVHRMALSEGRCIWPGELWRLQLIGGCVWMAAMTGYTFLRLKQGFLAFRPAASLTGGSHAR
jgi:hypothetical protein